MARTRGRDHGLAAAGGHLRGARCHPPGGGGAWSEARGREDRGGGQPADDQRHEGAGGGGEGREGPALRADLRRLRADVPAVGLDRCEQDQGDLQPRRADDHATEGGDGQTSPDRGGGHAGEGVVERLTVRAQKVTHYHTGSIMATATKTRLKIFPLADRVAIRPMEETEEMKGGLYIPDTAKEKPIQGEVIAVGPGRMEKGQRVPMELKVGDRVVYGKYTGSQVELDEEEIILIKESDVIAKLS